MTASTQKNSSGLKPLGMAVLVRPYDEAVKKKSIIAIPDPVKARDLLLEQKAVVIEVGPLAWDRERFRVLGIPLWKIPRARPGDMVILAQYSGYMSVGPADGIQYRMVNCNDIFAAVTKEAESG